MRWNSGKETYLIISPEEKEIEIKKWLSAFSPDQALKDRLEFRTQKTCNWHLKDPRIQS